MGFTVMPVFSSLLSTYADKQQGRGALHYIDAYNAPALLMLLMCAIAWILLCFAFDTSTEDSHIIKPIDEEPASSETELLVKHESPNQRVLLALCVLNFSTKGSISVYETLGAEVGYNTYNLNTITVGTLFSTSGVLGALILLTFPWLAKMCDDVSLMNGGISVMVVAASLLLNIEVCLLAL
jgi:Na+/melibiose symporter-like transporter